MSALNVQLTTMTEYRLILASNSPQRRELLAGAGYEFEVIPPHESAECGICSEGGPASLVIELASTKAADVAGQLKQRGQLGDRCLLIACDTVAECKGQILGKPRDEDHARQMLQLLSGNVHRVYSGLCVWRPVADGVAGEPEIRLAISELQMDPLSETEIDNYLEGGLWRDKAGAFGYQDRPGWLRLVSGSESNVVGLPLELLHEMLSTLGVKPP